MSSPREREHVRRLKIKAAALERHRASRGPDGKSLLAVEAGRASGVKRLGDKGWAVRMAIRRWYPDTKAIGADNARARE